MNRALTIASVLAAVLSILACSGEEADDLTLVRLESGDAACYVVVRNAAGAEESLPGDFELCPGGGKDASKHVGKEVELETRKEKMQAPSCQGNPECADSVGVDLVVDIDGD